MKFILTVITFLVFTHAARAQNFVEVTVIDTVLVSADQFIFQVMAMPDAMVEMTETVPPSRNDYVRREREMRLQQKKVLEAVEARLKAAGFNPVPASIQEMMMHRGYGNYFLTYSIPSVEALQRFRNLFEKEQQVNAILQQARSSKEETHHHRLMAKLMSKAREKANLLAALSGKKVTGIISISDMAADWTGASVYGTTSTTRPAEEPQYLNTNYPLHAKLIVRFSWE